MVNIRISQSGVEFLADVRNYLQEAELSGYSVKETADLFRKEQEQAIILELLDAATDTGLERDQLTIAVTRHTGWSPEKAKRIISDLYRDGKKIELYDPNIDYAPSSTERELGSKKVEDLKRLHRREQFEAHKAANWCEKCQRYHFGHDTCPHCEQ